MFNILDGVETNLVCYFGSRKVENKALDFIVTNLC